MTKADRFHALHRGERILALPNAWDAASARVLELAGAAAIATTSAGVAASLGYPDGERVDRDLMLAAVARIARAVDVPVSADLEAGYGATTEAVCATVEAVLAAGVVGVNLEDRLEDPAILVERIGAVREVAVRAGVRLFINARTDVWLGAGGDAAARFADGVARLLRYQAAGADGLFAPGLGDRDAIARLVRAVDRPLNVLAGDGVPSAPELQRLGVARVSVGSGPMRATLGLLRDVATELLGPGTYASFAGRGPSHAEVNAMFRAMLRRPA